MGALTPDPNTTGKGLFEGTSSFRSKDDQSDRKVGGSYNHNATEASATEANEWIGYWQYINSVMRTMGGALDVRNETGGTLSAGPVRITGYDETTDKFLIAAADAAANTHAHLILKASLANNTSGVAYMGGEWTSTLDASAASEGQDVFLAAGGGITLTAPTGADQIQQVVGQVKDQTTNAVIKGAIRPPRKFGTSWLQLLSVTNALIANGTIDLTTKVTGALPVANGGTGLASFTAGDLLYATAATTLAKLAKGTAGQVLRMNAGATAPEWAALPRGYATKSANYTVVASDDGYLIDVDASGGNITIALTAAATLGAAFRVGVRKSDSSANTVTIDPDSAETIDGAATNVINAQHGVVWLRCTGSAFVVEGANDFLQSRVTAATNVPAANNVWGNLTTLSVPPGEWDLTGLIVYNLNGSTTSGVGGALSVNSGGTTTDHVYGDNLSDNVPPTTNYHSPVTLPTWRVKVTAATTYYLKGIVAYSAGTPQYRCRLSARRVG